MSSLPHLLYKSLAQGEKWRFDILLVKSTLSKPAQLITTTTTNITSRSHFPLQVSTKDYRDTQREKKRRDTMPSLTLPLVQNPPFALLALALIQDIPVGWDTESGETGETKYGEVVGAEKVREELEKGVDGKEVCLSSFVLQPSPSPVSLYFLLLLSLARELARLHKSCELRARSAS